MFACTRAAQYIDFGRVRTCHWRLGGVGALKIALAQVTKIAKLGQLSSVRLDR